MAATSITISNTKEAIENGIFKGKLTDIYEFEPIRYTVGKNNKISQYTIVIKLLNSNNEIIPITDEMLEGGKIDSTFKVSIETISIQEGGKIREMTPTYVTTGKNIGKVNETNMVTQAFRDALRLYNIRLSKVSSNLVGRPLEDEEPSPKNDHLLMPPPMLVQKIQNNILTEEDFTNGITLQKKLNGVHYITFLNDTEIVKYSRSGLIYPKSSMPKLTKEMKTIFNNSKVFCSSNTKLLNDIKVLLQLTDGELELYKGAMPYYAGELYKHGISLNIISGQARKENTSIDLEYHIFDVFFPTVIEKGHNLISSKRQLFIDYIFEKVAPFELTNIKRVQNYPVYNMLEINALAENFIADGYEGAIARKNNGIYRYSINNYHSKEVLKIKPTFDSEFIISGFTQGTKGKDLGAIIWICSVGSLQFHVVPNMPLAERKKLYKKLSESDTIALKLPPIGKLLTVSYAELSPNGIPLQPKGIAIRDYE